MRQYLSANNLDSAIRFFLYVFIFWLPYSPAVIEVCVIWASFVWLVKRFLHCSWKDYHQLSAAKKFEFILKKFFPPQSILNRPIGFFLFFCLLSALGSIFWEHSLQNFITKMVEWFVIYYLFFDSFREKKHIKILLIVFAVTAFSTILDSFYQFYITQKDIFLGHQIEPNGAATAGFKTPNDLGGYLTIVLPFFFSLCLLKIKRFYGLLFRVLFFMSVWSLVITDSRGGWAGIIAGGLFFMIMLILKSKYSRRLVISIIVGGLILYFIGMFISQGQWEGFFLKRINTVQWRWNVWQDSIEMIKDRPLLGHGVNTFMQLILEYQKTHYAPTYAHNCFIQMAAETGILGLSSFLWIFVALTRYVLAGNIKTPLDKLEGFDIVLYGLLAGTFAFLVQSFFDTNFYSVQLSAFFWCIIGIQVAIVRNKQNLLKQPI